MSLIFTLRLMFLYLELRFYIPAWLKYYNLKNKTPAINDISPINKTNYIFKNILSSITYAHF